MPKRRCPVGAEVLESGVHFRVWAPDCEHIDVIINGHQVLPLKKEKEGYFSIFAQGAQEGSLYQFWVESTLLPDPASRYQPQGCLGPSCVVNPLKFSWSDEKWRGISSIKGQVIYELHIGTFTQEGTWRAASEKLPHLADLGVTIIEMMPIGDFSGEFGWGYDGTHLYAPYHKYGTPDDLRDFINRAHEYGIGVILDVVYNHFGPHGDYMMKFSKYYISENSTTDWGRAINFDGEQAFAVREFFISNAIYWIDEFHFDGLRLDATQNIYDRSSPHILAEITARVHAHSSHHKVIVTAENEPQDSQLLQSKKEGGYGIDAVWNDDFHHSALVLLTGRREAYYTDYLGKAQEILSALKYGYLFQGQHYKWQNKKRGSASLKIAFEHFILYLENHDQVANSSRSLRLHQMSDCALLRLMTTLLLLAPQTPLLFQGQEFGSSRPFYFFADHSPEINRLVWEGRKTFLSQFPSCARPEMQAYYPDPGDKNNFLESKLNWDEIDERMHRELYLLHRDLIKIRREDPVFTTPEKIDGAVLSPTLFILRYFAHNDDDRLILFNLGVDEVLSPLPEPLYAPPFQKKWKEMFSSQSPQYGGIGSPLFKNEEWQLPGRVATVLKPVSL